MNSNDQDVMARFDQLAEVLRQTFVSIPQALAEERRLAADLGASEIRGDADDLDRAELMAVKEDREAAVRKRRAAMAALLELEPQLAQERRAAEQRRAELTGSVISEFAGRWNEALRVLASLHGEAEQLSRVLHVPVATRAPYRIGFDVGAGDKPVLRFDLSGEPPTLVLPPELQAVVATMERLDAATGVIGGLKWANEQGQRHRRLCESRGVPVEMHGVFTVTRSFDYLGSTFAPGTLVNRELLGDSMLYRLVLGRNIRVVDAVEMAA